MKKNFMIAVNKDNAEAYKKTLIALGYPWSEYQDEQDFRATTKTISGFTCGSIQYCWFSSMTLADNVFDNITDFLIWHFTPEKTQAEIELEKLQEQIVSLQNQAEKLKASL